MAGTCAMCGKELEGGGMMSERGEVCPDCFDTVDRPRPKFPPLLIAALVAGGIPFMFRVYTIDSSGFRDYVALCAGGVAAIIGVILAIGIAKAPNKAIQAGYAAIAVGIGVFQILRGLGVVLIGYDLG